MREGLSWASRFCFVTTTKVLTQASFNRMKRTVVFFLLVLAFSQLALSQEKPLSQAEYVKLLYGLQKNPASKAEIIDALRRRGIAFVLTDGVRGLTRSKGGNDDELKRAARRSGSAVPESGSLEASVAVRDRGIYR